MLGLSKFGFKNIQVNENELEEERIYNEIF